MKPIKQMINIKSIFFSEEFCYTYSMLFDYKCFGLYHNKIILANKKIKIIQFILYIFGLITDLVPLFCFFSQFWSPYFNFNQF
jgi:hypothetical protein